jgi:hypothetical protein
VKRYMTLLVSDGGAPFLRTSDVATDPIRQLQHVFDITDNQVRRDLVARYQLAGTLRPISRLTLKLDPTDSPPIGKLVGVTLICRVALAPFRRSLTDRRLKFVNFIADSDQDPSDELDYILNVSDLADETQFRIAGGTLRDVDLPDEERRIAGTGSADTIIISWKDENRLALRDVLLVLIGGIVGLGAAAALEWLRPTIDTPGSIPTPDA